MKVPFLEDKHIQSNINNLMQGYYIKNYELDKKDNYEVDIIDLATNYLRYKIKFCDLQEWYGDRTLGMIIPEAKVILCDNSIEPVGERKEIRERVLRFTIAHEIGHHQLHLPYMIDSSSPLFHTKLSKKEKDRIETQANIFASKLLLPEEKIRKAFQIFSIKNNIYLTSPNIFQRRKQVISDLSDYFNVSKEAITNRLRNLELINWLHYR